MKTVDFFGGGTIYIYAYLYTKTVWDPIILSHHGFRRDHSLNIGRYNYNKQILVDPVGKVSSFKWCFLFKRGLDYGSHLTSQKDQSIYKSFNLSLHPTKIFRAATPWKLFEKKSILTVNFGKISKSSKWEAQPTGSCGFTAPSKNLGRVPMILMNCSLEGEFLYIPGMLRSSKDSA